MTEAMYRAVAERFRALAEPMRLKILRHLLDQEATIGDLAQAIGASQANASKHVAILAAAGFVDRRKSGTSVLCAIADPIVPELCDLMCEKVLSAATRNLEEVRLPRSRRSGKNA